MRGCALRNAPAPDLPLSAQIRPLTARAVALGRRLLGVALALTVGCGGPPRDYVLPPMPVRAELLQGASVGPGDVVEVRVYQEQELTGVFRLAADGTFTFPLVGRVMAEGLTPNDLADHIQARLAADYLRNPQVSVFVKEYNSKKVFVLGEVQRPGTFQYEDAMSIVQAVTLAGGFKPQAAKNRVVLTRVVEGTERNFVVPIERIGLGQQANVPLQPGDIVFVPESWL